MVFKKVGFLAASLLGFILLLPMFLYWYGLSNLEALPQVSSIKLTPEQELEIWNKEKEAGIPRLKATNPYGYIAYFYCNVSNGLHIKKCAHSYPGLRVSALAVRNQVAEQVQGKGNTVWQLTWLAYSIWVTRNWSIHEVLTTCHEEYDGQ